MVVIIIIYGQNELINPKKIDQIKYFADYHIIPEKWVISLASYKKAVAKSKS